MKTASGSSGGGGFVNGPCLQNISDSSVFCVWFEQKFVSLVISGDRVSEVAKIVLVTNNQNFQLKNDLRGGGQSTLYKPEIQF